MPAGKHEAPIRPDGPLSMGCLLTGTSREPSLESQLRKAIDGALTKIPALPEWQDEAWLKRNNYPPFADALRQLHRPGCKQPSVESKPKR